MAKYLNLPGGAGGLTAFYSILTFWVAYSHLIPLSLNVGIEVLKLSQGALVGRDAKMYDAETEKYALSRSSDLIEELGQVDFVFSDKTGTLTQNKMMYRKCSVNGVIYGEGEGEALLLSLAVALEEGLRVCANWLALPQNRLKEALGDKDCCAVGDTDTRLEAL